MSKVFTYTALPAGRVFSFYFMDRRLQPDEEIEIWAERSNNGLGDPIVYGKARVIEIPYHPAHIYKAMVLSK